MDLYIVQESDIGFDNRIEIVGAFRDFQQAVGWILEKIQKSGRKPESPELSTRMILAMLDGVFSTCEFDASKLQLGDSIKDDEWKCRYYITQTTLKDWFPDTTLKDCF